MTPPVPVPDDEHRLSGVVVVTGAGPMGSIGRVVARRVAELGADVIVSDIDRPIDRIGPDERRRGWRGLDDVAEEIEGLGRRSRTVRCDITDRVQVDALMAAAADLGPVTGLVNAARAFMRHERRHVVEMEEEDWDWVLAVNLRGPMSCSAAAARTMAAAGTAGSIVNVSSMAGTQASPGGAPYCTSKAGLDMLTRVMALELAPQGIRVNAVAPGIVATNRVSVEDRRRADDEGIDVEEYRRRWLEEAAGTVPLRRVADPADVASVVGFLLSPASRYVTGERIDVSGGLGAR